MIRHVVLLSLRPDAPADAAGRIVAALGELPSQVPSIRAYEVGVDAGISEGNATVGVTALFDDGDGYTAYRDHPAHRAVVERFVGPVVESRSAIQFEV